jgi:hypothetical protein
MGFGILLGLSYGVVEAAMAPPVPLNPPQTQASQPTRSVGG